MASMMLPFDNNCGTYCKLFKSIYISSCSHNAHISSINKICFGGLFKVHSIICYPSGLLLDTRYITTTTKPFVPCIWGRLDTRHIGLNEFIRC